MNRYHWGRYKHIYLGIDFADRGDYTCLVVAEDLLWYGPNPATDFTPEVRGELGDPHSARGWKSPLELSPRALAEVIEANNEAGFEGVSGAGSEGDKALPRHRLPEGHSENRAVSL